METKRAITSELTVSYEEYGSVDGNPVLLLHGWPYSIRCYDEVSGPLANAGLRVIVPELRGFGETRYLHEDIMRTAQQAALGKDIVELLDALTIPSAVLVGYDWGGRGACVAATLWPERVAGLVTMQGYAIVDRIELSTVPEKAKAIHNKWYQWIMQIPLGETVLKEMRDEFTKECWKTFSPKYDISDAQFEAQAASFRNPDWITTTLQQYRWVHGNADGSPELQPLEEKLAQKPKIDVPAIALVGDSDAMSPLAETAEQDKLYKGFYERRVISAGHCPPMEAPSQVVEAVLNICEKAFSNGL